MDAPSSPLESVEFADNPEPRCPCVLLLDTSGSMQGAPIDALNPGLKAFRDDLNKDPLASRRVDVAVVTSDSEGKPKSVVQPAVHLAWLNRPRPLARAVATASDGLL